MATLAGSLARLIPKVLAADLHGWKRIGGNEKQKNAMIILIALKAFKNPLHLGWPPHESLPTKLIIFEDNLRTL
ncbi:MAG: hypothetical protein ABSD20_07460 [Terriglobales bacterium]